MGISVLLLAYKEEENLRVLLPRIKEALSRVPEAYEILVVDTASPLDNTASVCAEFGARYFPQEEDGYAGAFRTGIKYASKDKLLNLDSDGSHPPEVIEEIYRKFTGQQDGVPPFDIVIGSRYVKGGTTNDAASSIIMSKILNFVMKLVLGVRAKDISTSFRMYDAAQLKNIVLTRRNFDVLQEVIMRMKLNKNGKFRVGEVPILFGKRLNGLSTRRLFSFIVSYIGTCFMLLGLRVSSNMKKK